MQNMFFVMIIAVSTTAIGLDFIKKIIKMSLQHHERIEKIRRGMDPDADIGYKKPAKESAVPGDVIDYRSNAN